MYSVIKTIVVAALVAVLAFTLAACDSNDRTAAQASQLESKSQANSYGAVVREQPAHKVNYSPAREDKNFYIDTWLQHQRNAYVYLLTGDRVFFYVMGGPPTNRCDSLTPPDYWYENSNDNAPDSYRPAPRVDGVYPGGGTCTTFIGRDATTGGYLEFTLNQSTLMTVYSEAQPFPENILTPLGDTKTNK